MIFIYIENPKDSTKNLTQINGKICQAHGLEELTLPKCPYYLKQSNSIQSLSKSQEHCSQK